MLLKGPRFVTYGAALAAIGVVMVLVSVYTPFGRRVLFLLSGMPVMLAANIGGKKGSLTVYAVTAMLILLLVQPLKGLGYFLVAGGVPLVLSVFRLPLVGHFSIASLLSASYLLIAVKFMGLPLEENISRLTPWLLGSSPRLVAVGAVLVLLASCIYVSCLKLLKAYLEKHWVYDQLFKP